VWNFGIRLIVFSFLALLLKELKLSLENARMLAATDPLTGVWNSREFYRIAEIELRRARRLQYPISIAYLDIDNFKQVNDQRGHTEGDKLLRCLAQNATNALRKTDTFARLGGDEFVILLPNTDAQQSKIVIRKLKDIAKPTDTWRDMIPVTFSIGVATFKMPPNSLEELVKRADALMYKGKLKGKNRIVATTIK
jgi:diguanylate cyclase (GGDEF)-like protein